MRGLYEKVRMSLGASVLTDESSTKAVFMKQIEVIKKLCKTEGIDHKFQTFLKPN